MVVVVIDVVVILWAVVEIVGMVVCRMVRRGLVCVVDGGCIFVWVVGWVSIQGSIIVIIIIIVVTTIIVIKFIGFLLFVVLVDFPCFLC